MNKFGCHRHRYGDSDQVLYDDADVESEQQSSKYGPLKHFTDNMRR